MKPSMRIFEQNLEQLMRRAYRPVRPREAFVRQLEEALAPYIGEPVQTQKAPISLLRPALGFALAAAAALLLLFAWGPWKPQPISGPPVVTLDSILDAGEVALRQSADGPWRPASPRELAEHVAPEAGFLELVTPRELGAVAAGPEGWTVALPRQSRLGVRPTESGLRFSLSQGAAAFEGAGQSRELDAPREVLWFAGGFHDMDGTPWGRELVEEAQPTIPSERVVVDVDPAPELPVEDVPEEAPPIIGGGIRGRVLSARDNVQVTGFQVSLLRAVPLPQVADTETYSFDGDEFELLGLEPGDYEVYITAPGHAVWRRTEIPLREGEVWEPEVLLNQGGTVRGYVVEKSTGAGLPGALVVSSVDMPSQIIGMTEDHFPEGARAFTYTKADGSFEFPMLSLGAHILRASHEEFAPTWIPVEVGEERGDNQIFELTSGGSVHGRCEHPDGQPFSRAMLIVSRFAEGSTGRSMTYEQAFTDAEGRYLVENLSPGGYVVLFFGTGQGQQVFQPQYQPVVIREGQRQEASFLGEHRGASVRGTVYGPDGEPVPFANMHTLNLSRGDFAWQGDTTDENGEFEIVGLEEGQYQIFAGEGNATTLGANLRLEMGDRVERDIHLEGTEFRVRVVDDQTGKPVELVEVALERRLGKLSELERGIERVARSFHTSQDEVVLKYLTEGTYDLLVLSESPEYGVLVIPDVWVDGDGPGDALEVRLTRPSLATIRVVETDGTPIPGARVRAMDQRGADWASLHRVRTNAEGSVTFGRLPSGLLRFEVSHGVFGTHGAELHCSPEEPGELTFTLSRD